MAEVTSFATRSCSSYNMRVRRLPGRKFGLVHRHVVPIPTPDGKVTAISFSGHDPECCEEAKDALTFPAGSAVGRLLHVPRATSHGEVHNTPRDPPASLWGGRKVEASTPIRDKLDAANRTHAVVNAMRRRYWIGRLLKKNQSRALGAQIHVTSGVNAMSHVTYKIVQHDGGWAYKVGDVFSESYLSRTEAHAAADKAAREQHTPGETTSIEFEDPSGHWRQEIAPGNDRPETDVED